MTSKKAVGIYIVISFFVGGLVGFVAGGYISFELTTTRFGNKWLDEQANDISSRITILKNVREGRHEEAVEVMERQLEDDLISIEPDHRIKEGTLSAINGAIQNAKDYRTQYPRTPSRPSIEKMVADVFKRAPYK